MVILEEQTAGTYFVMRKFRHLLDGKTRFATKLLRILDEQFSLGHYVILQLCINKSYVKQAISFKTIKTLFDGVLDATQSSFVDC